MRLVLSARALPAVAVAALLLASACGSDGSSPTPSPAPSPAVVLPSRTPEPTPTTAPTPAPTPEPTIQRIAYAGPSGDVWIMNADGSAKRKLLDIAPGDAVTNIRWAPDGSKLAIAEREVSIVGSDGQKLLDVPGIFIGWSPSSDLLVAHSFTTGEESLIVLNLEGSVVFRFIDGALPSFSSDGRYLAFFHLGPAEALFPRALGMLADLETSEVSPIDSGEESSADIFFNGPPVFSPTDPDLLAYGPRLFDLTSGRQEPLPAGAVLWIPDGGGLILRIIRDSRPYVIYDPELQRITGEVQLSGIRGDPPPWALPPGLNAWSPDGRLLATYNDFLEDRLGLRILDTSTHEDKRIPVEKASSLAFSPDGRWLLFSSPDGIWVVESGGTNLTLLAEGAAPAWQPQP